jgi:nitrogen fixation protein NifT
MKIMICRAGGAHSVYVPKKDLEEPIIASEKEGLWGGWVRLKNGWVLELPEMPRETTLPVTVQARKRGEE